MRAHALISLLVVAGCSSDVLDNTAYRRLLDGHDSYDQCLAAGEPSCYQTLTFCADGRVNANLDYRQEGTYSVHDTEAIVQLPSATVWFDLVKQSSAQLPGRHSWELVEPLYYDCAQ